MIRSASPRTGCSGSSTPTPWPSPAFWCSVAATLILAPLRSRRGADRRPGVDPAGDLEPAWARHV